MMSTDNEEQEIHKSILPVHLPVSTLVTKTRIGLCSLCKVEKYKHNRWHRILRHMKIFHEKHSFIRGGYRFLICRLYCHRISHYHCVCGRICDKLYYAMSHTRQCPVLNGHGISIYDQVRIRKKMSKNAGSLDISREIVEEIDNLDEDVPVVDIDIGNCENGDDVTPVENAVVARDNVTAVKNTTVSRNNVTAVKNTTVTRDNVTAVKNTTVTRDNVTAVKSTTVTRDNVTPITSTMVTRSRGKTSTNLKEVAHDNVVPVRNTTVTRDNVTSVSNTMVTRSRGKISMTLKEITASENTKSSTVNTKPKKKPTKTVELQGPHKKVSMKLVEINQPQVSNDEDTEQAASSVEVSDIETRTAVDDASETQMVKDESSAVIEDQPQNVIISGVHYSIIEQSESILSLAPEDSAFCPFCSHTNLDLSSPDLLHSHMEQVHEKPSFVYLGLRFLKCSLDCDEKSHYHCVCGEVYNKRYQAVQHIHQCSLLHPEARELTQESCDGNNNEDNDNNDDNDDEMAETEDIAEENVQVGVVSECQSIVPDSWMAVDLLTSSSTQCPLCSPSKCPPTDLHSLQAHMKTYHEKPSISFHGMKYLFCRRDCIKFSHFHCHCGDMVQFRPKAVQHIQSCVPSSQTTLPQTKATGADHSYGFNSGIVEHPSIMPASVSAISLADNLPRFGPCPLCLTSKFRANKKYKVLRHLTVFHDKHSLVTNGRRIVICRLGCRNRSHYHCVCGYTQRSYSLMLMHIEGCATFNSPAYQTQWQEQQTQQEQQQQQPQQQQQQEQQQQAMPITIDGQTVVGEESTTDDMENSEKQIDGADVMDVIKDCHVSIMSASVSITAMVSSTSDTCPLCPKNARALNDLEKLRNHLRHTHELACILHHGIKFLVCKMDCEPVKHYHCVCGVTSTKKRQAEEHIRACMTLNQLVPADSGSEITQPLDRFPLTNSPSPKAPTTYEHVSIVPASTSVDSLFPSAPCTLCRSQRIVPDDPTEFARHMSRVHDNRSCVSQGLRFLVCNLDCMLFTHYHCVCGHITPQHHCAKRHYDKCATLHQNSLCEAVITSDTTDTVDTAEEGDSTTEDVRDIVTTPSDPEKHPSILPATALAKSLTPAGFGPCPLCTETKFKPAYPKDIRIHLRHLHELHSFVSGGKKFLLCRLPCLPSGKGHYHCTCGKICRLPTVAMRHTQKCLPNPPQLMSPQRNPPQLMSSPTNPPQLMSPLPANPPPPPPPARPECAKEPVTPAIKKEGNVYVINLDAATLGEDGNFIVDASGLETSQNVIIEPGDVTVEQNQQDILSQVFNSEVMSSLDGSVTSNENIIFVTPDMVSDDGGIEHAIQAPTRDYVVETAIPDSYEYYKNHKRIKSTTQCPKCLKIISKCNISRHITTEACMEMAEKLGQPDWKQDLMVPREDVLYVGSDSQNEGSLMENVIETTENSESPLGVVTYKEMRSTEREYRDIPRAHSFRECPHCGRRVSTANLPRHMKSKLCLKAGTGVRKFMKHKKPPVLRTLLEARRLREK